MLAVDGKLPVSYKFITMKFNPGLNEAELLLRKVTRDEFPITDADCSFKLRVSCVDMRKVVMLIVDEIHSNYDPIEHRNYRHLRVSRQRHRQYLPYNT